MASQAHVFTFLVCASFSKKLNQIKERMRKKTLNYIIHFITLVFTHRLQIHTDTFQIYPLDFAFDMKTVIPNMKFNSHNTMYKDPLIQQFSTHLPPNTTQHCKCFIRFSITSSLIKWCILFCLFLFFFKALYDNETTYLFSIFFLFPNMPYYPVKKGLRHLSQPCLGLCLFDLQAFNSYLFWDLTIHPSQEIRICPDNFSILTSNIAYLSKLFIVSLNYSFSLKFLRRVPIFPMPFYSF